MSVFKKFTQAITGYTNKKGAINNTFGKVDIEKEEGPSLVEPTFNNNVDPNIKTDKDLIVELKKENQRLRDEIVILNSKINNK